LIKVLSPKSIRRAGETDQEARKVLAGTMKDAIKGEGRKIDFARAGISIGLVVVWMIVYALAFATKTPFVSGIVFWGGLVGISLCLRGLVVRKLGPAFAYTYVSNGFCGQCGYKLEGLAPERDGCIRCPECGAAWAKERVTWPSWVHGPLKPPPRASFLKRILSGVPLTRERWTPDDRGALRCVVDSRLYGWGDAAHKRLIESERRELVGQIRRLGRIGRIVLSMPFFLIAATLVVVMAYHLLPPHADMAILFIFFPIVIFALGGYALNLGHTFLSWGKAARLICDRGLCPCCAEDLRANPHDGSGLTVCPGCGGSWRIACTPIPTS
jgi:hypothetical protein